MNTTTLFKLGSTQGIEFQAKVDEAYAVTERMPDARRCAERLPSILTFLKSSRGTVESYERELIQFRSLEIRLRDALAESEARLRQQDDLIQRQELPGNPIIG